MNLSLVSGTAYAPPILSRRDVRLRQRPPFAVAGLIHRSLTGIVGEPYIGKSALVALLVSTALARSEFLGRPWNSDVAGVLLVGTDASSADEYESRLTETGLLSEDDPRVHYLERFPSDQSQWEEVVDQLDIGDDWVVVIDNLTGVIPDLNSTKDVHDFFQLIESSLCALGTCVIVVAHKSEKTGERGKSRTPMGSTGISARLRHVLYLDLKSKELTLTAKGNGVPEGEELKLRRGGRGAADYEVLSAVPVSQSDRQRDKATLDKRAEIARWVVANCQGMSKTEAAEAISARSGGSVSTHQKNLQPSRALGKLLVCEGGPDGRRWTTTERIRE